MQLISDLNNHKENLRGQLQHSYFSELVGLITSEICILCILLDVQLLIISGQVRFFFFVVVVLILAKIFFLF